MVLGLAMLTPYRFQGTTTTTPVPMKYWKSGFADESYNIEFILPPPFLFLFLNCTFNIYTNSAMIQNAGIILIRDIIIYRGSLNCQLTFSDWIKVTTHAHTLSVLRDGKFVRISAIYNSNAVPLYKSEIYWYKDLSCSIQGLVVVSKRFDRQHPDNTRNP